MRGETQPARPRRALLFRGFAGWQRHAMPGDLAAGLTLAAIAIPEQMATARLGGFPPAAGLFVFVAGTVAFAVFGANRYLSNGADSTITPIFAGALGVLAAQGSFHYAALAAALAVVVGAIMILSGIARLGWIANFLSVPVTTGFLAGVAVHIVVSQLPPLLGVPESGGDLVARVRTLMQQGGLVNPYALFLGALVFFPTLLAEKFGKRIPGALIGLAAAMSCVAIFGLDAKGVRVVESAPLSWPTPQEPAIGASEVGSLAALALVIVTVVMVQTAATTRAFASLADPRDVDRDFIGVGAGSLLAGLFGLFPANASPPRTAVVKAAGGHSQACGLVAACVVIAVVASASFLTRYLPLAGLAGILLAIALRITRPSTFALVLRQTPMEFALIVATMAAIVVLPIQVGAAVGIGLSVLHGIWTITRTRLIEFERVPNTSVWWPPGRELRGEKLARVRVVAFQAPLSFLNADEFRHDMIMTVERDDLDLIVFEASSVAEIDFTASQVLIEIIERCRAAGISFAIARLTSLRAQEALVRFGIIDRLGPRGLYRSVDEAIRAHDAGQGSRPNAPPVQPETA